MSNFLSLLPAVCQSPTGQLGTSYDAESDVLYVHFGAQSRPSTDGELTDDDIIVRYESDEFVGITIRHASQR